MRRNFSTHDVISVTNPQVKIIYLGDDAVGGRGLYSGIVNALGGVPRFHKSALISQTAELLAAEDHERGRTVVLVLGPMPTPQLCRPSVTLRPMLS